MTITKRHFIKSSITLAIVTLGGTHSARAGGSDPIPGIDVIIKKMSTKKPVVGFSVSRGEMKQFNELKGSDRARYLAKVLAKQLGRKFGKSEHWEKSVSNAMGKSWCGKCRENDGRINHNIRLKDDDVVIEIEFELSPKCSG